MWRNRSDTSGGSRVFSGTPNTVTYILVPWYYSLTFFVQGCTHYLSTSDNEELFSSGWSIKEQPFYGDL